MISSGTTAVATSGDAAVTLIASGIAFTKQITIINSGTPAGFFTIDGGDSWCYLPGGASATVPLSTSTSEGVQFKRIPSGTDCTGLYAWGL